MKLYVLNTPVLTDWGEYKFNKISLEGAKELLKGEFTSAVGHQATAEFMSCLLEIKIPTNRLQVKMETEDKALVFRVLTRLPEGKVLSTDEIKLIPYELGLLEKIK
jgi:hypothetical protein